MGGGLETTYDVHLELIGKRIVDFLLVLIEVFSLGVTARRDRKSAISLQRGHFDSKFQVEGVAPTNHSSSQKTRLNNLSYGIKIWTDLSSVLSQFTRLTDRRTDSFLIARLRLHSMQRSKKGELSATLDFGTFRPLVQMTNPRSVGVALTIAQ